jgi:DNA-binding XRE family transcriptional regulator
MITSRQVRAARALLGWTQEMLADKALVALTALKRLESESGSRCERTRLIRCIARSRTRELYFWPPNRAKG